MLAVPVLTASGPIFKKTYDNLRNFVGFTTILRHIYDSATFPKILWQSYEQS